MGPRPKQQPLHTNVVFLTFMGLAMIFMALSFLLSTKLDDLGEDDLILGSGGGDGLKDILLDRRHRHRRGKNKKRQRHTEKEEEEEGANDEEDDDNKHAKAIRKFQKDQEQAKKRRQRMGNLSPRELFEQDKFDPDDMQRIRIKVDNLRQREPPLPSDLPYDVRDCPHHPPDSYPFAWNVMDVLNNWNPDDTELPRDKIYHSLCIFDWNNNEDQARAEHYRKMEIPFVVHNFPETMRAAERWNTPGYLEELLGEEQVMNEHSHNNHFMYWKTRHPREDYVPPTDMVELTYKEWLKKAQELQEARRQTKQEHYYFRLNAMLHNHAYLYEELPFFDPTFGKSFTMVDPNEHRGINCRFGMKGVTAEAHFDSHNNFIALMGGQRRYILAHPDQCENLELYPLGHPSARHSRINWSNAYEHWHDSERPFVNAQVNEVVLQASDLLYLPTFWFHFIVSLDTNYQCNSRSGDSMVYEHHISKCGFGSRREYQRKG